MRPGVWRTPGRIRFGDMDMEARKRIALVAHDARKPALVEWVGRWRGLLAGHELSATGTTGRLLSEAYPDLRIERLKSGPLGGDQQLGAAICEGRLDALFFFTDPLGTQAHSDDVKALTRLAGVYDVVLCCTVAAADFVVSNPTFSQPYANRPIDPIAYEDRDLPAASSMVPAEAEDPASSEPEDSQPEGAEEEAGARSGASTAVDLPADAVAGAIPDLFTVQALLPGKRGPVLSTFVAWRRAEPIFDYSLAIARTLNAEKRLSRCCGKDGDDREGLEERILRAYEEAAESLDEHLTREEVDLVVKSLSENAVPYRIVPMELPLPLVPEDSDGWMASRASPMGGSIDAWVMDKEDDPVRIPGVVIAAIMDFEAPTDDL